MYCSPYARAEQTWKAMWGSLFDGINKNAIDIHNLLRKPYYVHEAITKYDPRLREQDWGNYKDAEVTKKIEADRDRFGTFFYRIPDGESGADVYDRLSSFMDTLWRDFSKKDFPRIVVIVTHGLTMRLFLMRWFHMDVELYETTNNPRNGEVWKISRVPTDDKKSTKDKWHIASQIYFKELKETEPNAPSKGEEDAKDNV
jgi:broad specificity phosphatase PhoE